MTRFEEGKMYWMNGDGWDPLKVISRSKSGQSVVMKCATGNKSFRVKIRVNPMRNSEYVVTDSHYSQDSWMWDDVSCYASRPLKDAEQAAWENLAQKG